MILSPTVVLAGTWIITAIGSGTNDGNPKGTVAPASVNQGIAYCRGNGPGGSSNYSLIVTGSWQPAPGMNSSSDPAPGMVYILETASATVGTGPSGSPTASDGLGDPGPAVAQQYFPGAPIFGYTASSAGKYVIPETVTGGTWTASLTGNTTGSPSTGSTASASITVDGSSRGSVITSGPPTYRKGPNNSLLLNGSIGTANEIDTVVGNGASYISIVEDANGRWNQNSLASISYPLPSGVFFNNSANFGPTNGLTVVDTAPFYLYNLPSKTIVSCSAVDGVDNARVKSNITVIVHAPVDNWQQISTQPAGIQILGTASGTSALQQAIITPTPAAVHWSGATQIGSGVSATATAIYAATDPPLAMIGLLTAGSWALSQVQPPRQRHSRYPILEPKPISSMR